MSSSRPRVEITRRAIGLVFMQVCAIADATDEEILAVCNTQNEAGTEQGWTTVWRTDGEDGEKLAPVPCDQHPGRIHFLVNC